MGKIYNQLDLDERIELDRLRECRPFTSTNWNADEPFSHDLEPGVASKHVAEGRL